MRHLGEATSASGALLLAAVAILLGCGSHEVEPQFAPPKGFYNYAPSVIRLDEKSQVAYYCTNTEPYVIRDSIGFRKASLVRGKWQWGDEKIVLGPGVAGWDAVHVCDPSIVAGEFRDGANTYNFALFYLGCDTTNVTHNQVGVAFSRDPAGPWQKWELNPIAPYPEYDRWWGTGQPSAVSIDSRGRIVLFYTRGDGNSTRVVARELDLSDLTFPAIGEEFEVTVDGLTAADGSKPIFHNAEFTRLPGGEYVVVRSRHPFGTEYPDFIASEVQVAALSGGFLDLKRGRWEVISNIGYQVTGWPRNHNVGMVRDRYGWVADGSEMEIMLSLSALGRDSLWTYRVAIVKTS